MSIFLTVLSVIAAVIGGLIALVLAIILILLPIRAELIVGYNKEDSFFLKVRYATVTINILPSKKDKNKAEKTKKEDKDPSETKENKEEKPKAVKKKPESKENKEEDQGKDNFFEKKLKLLVFGDYLTLLGHVGDFLSRFRFGDINANIIVASEDAATTAQRYGILTAVIFPMLGKIHNEKRAKDIDVHINADFSTEKTYADVYIEIYVRTVHAIALAFKALIHILKLKETNNGK